MTTATKAKQQQQKCVQSSLQQCLLSALCSHIFWKFFHTNIYDSLNNILKAVCLSCMPGYKKTNFFVRDGSLLVSCSRCDSPISTSISMCANIFSLTEKLYRFGQIESTVRKYKRALLVCSEYSSRKVSVWGSEKGLEGKGKSKT